MTFGPEPAEDLDIVRVALLAARLQRQRYQRHVRAETDRFGGGSRRQR